MSMTPSLTLEELHALLALNAMGSAHRKILECLQNDINPSEIQQKIIRENFLEKAETLEKITATFNAAEELERCRQSGIRVVTVFDDDYPVRLKQICDPPLLLYIKGELQAHDAAALAVVGSRRPNFYGREQTQKFSRELAEFGITIVSGFAKGVDQESHRAALRVKGGRTLAVMGCGLDVDYPRGSDELKEKIVERGALISEYPLGTQPYAGNFPKRNRIISGLSVGVLVVQANAKSGSLITAHEALEQGRFVFSVPGSVDQMQSRGTHFLLKEGASLAECTQDILTEIKPGLMTESQGEIRPYRAESQGKGLGGTRSGEEQQQLELTLPLGTEELVKALEGGEGLFFDEITCLLGLGHAETASLLLQLQLRKKLTKGRDGRFALTPSVSYS